jgi:hypothetical protein|tara:strand:+ start:424 stop:1125 length:702 start_codon:yes stop_codon:yes gene_type:complete
MAEESAIEEQPTMGDLMQLVHQQGQQIASLSSQLESAGEQMSAYTDALQQEQEYEPDHGQMSEEELESMTNAQLMSHIEQRVGNAIQNAVGSAMEPVSNDLAATQQYMQNNNVNSEINRMSNLHSDFQPLANDIADIIQQRSNNGYNISMEDAYHIAKAEHPDKVADINRELAPQRPSLGGGLLPTSKMIGETGEGQDMDFDEAMDKAFKEEVTDQGLNNLFDDSGIAISEAS